MSRELVQQAMMQLLNSKSKFSQSKRFYGFFLQSMRKHYDVKGIDTAGVNITDQINLYINSDFFKTQTLEQRVEILEHECDHIIKDHQGRAKKLDINDHKLWNIAADATINYKLKSLQNYGITVEKLRELIPDLLDNETTEYYFQKLKQYRNENGGKGGQGEQALDGVGDLIDDHSVWGKSEDLKESNGESAQGQHIEEINRQIIKKAMQEAVDKCNGRGNVPIDILRSLDSLNAATVNWKQQLKQFFAKADKFAKKPTRKKLNRRYRHLNPGRRKDPQTHIAVAVDESGSVCDSLHKQFFSEINQAASIDGIKFTIIHADCQINRVYEYEVGMKIERTGMGGTEYMPAINKAKELGVDGMIYFGDGDIFGEQLTKPNFPFLWAMEDGRNAPVDWGRVCHVKYPEGQNCGY